MNNIEIKRCDGKLPCSGCRLFTDWLRTYPEGREALRNRCHGVSIIKPVVNGKNLCLWNANGERPIGIMNAYPNGSMWEIAVIVDPKSHRCGVATKLLNFLQDELQAFGPTTLVAHVEPSNDSVRPWLKDRGFISTGLDDGEICYQKNLG